MHVHKGMKINKCITQQKRCADTNITTRAFLDRGEFLFPNKKDTYIGDATYPENDLYVNILTETKVTT